jgi:hypothetical protein
MDMAGGNIGHPRRRIQFPLGHLPPRILFLRGQRVMIDSELAAMYGKRNIDRFPGDFMFQLATEERDVLRSRSVISKRPRLR